MLRLGGWNGRPPVHPQEHPGERDEVGGYPGGEESQHVVELGGEIPYPGVLLVEIAPHGVHEVGAAEHHGSRKAQESEVERRRADAVHQVLGNGLAAGRGYVLGVHALGVAADDHLHLGGSVLHPSSVQIGGDGVAVVPEREHGEGDFEHERGDHYPCYLAPERRDQLGDAVAGQRGYEQPYGAEQREHQEIGEEPYDGGAERGAVLHPAVDGVQYVAHPSQRMDGVRKLPYEAVDQYRENHDEESVHPEFHLIIDR